MPYQLIDGRLVSIPARAAARAPRNPLEPDDGLLSTIGGAGLSGLSIAGNLLDIPGSMVRDVLAFQNPFDQLLTPTTGENRAYGRDILANWGLSAPNKETGMGGWLDDPMEGVRDLSGFAFDVATDPLTYMTFGASALTKVGQVAKRSGLIDTLPSLLGKGVGKRIGRQTHSLDDLIRAAPDQHAARQSAAEAAQSMGHSLYGPHPKGYVDPLQGPLGHSFGLGMPFKDPSVTFNAGPLGRGVARGLDAVGGAIAKSPPGRFVKGLFHAPSGGHFDHVAQEISEAAHRNKSTAIAAARAEGLDAFERMDEAYRAFDEEFGEAIRKPQLADEIDPRDLNEAIDEVLHRKLDEWSDPALHFERQFRKKHWPSWGRHFLKGGDVAGLPPGNRFDEAIEEFRRETGNPLATEDDVVQSLLKNDPRPTRTSPDIIEAAKAKVSRTQLQGLTEEAKALVSQGDGVPAFVSKNMRRILEENGIPDQAIQTKTPGELIDMLAENGKAFHTVHTFSSGDVVLAGDRGNYGYVQSVGRKSTEVLFRDPETGATAVKILPNDQVKRAFRKGSAEADEFSRLMTRKVFDDIVRHTAETGNVREAFGELAPGLAPPPATLEDAILKHADDMKHVSRVAYDSYQAKGGKGAWLNKADIEPPTPSIEHFHRSVDPKVYKESTGKAYPTSFGGAKGRTLETRNIPAALVNRMLRENRYRGQSAARNIAKDFSEHLDDTWGVDPDAFDPSIFGAPQLSESLQKLVDDFGLTEGQAKHAEAIADWITGHGKTDLYTKQHLDNFLKYQQGVYLASNTMEAIHEVFRRNAGQAAEGMVRLADAFRKSSMDPERAVKHFAEKFGISKGQANKMHVPQSVVDGANALNKTWEAPEWAQAMGDAIDKFTGLFKTSVTVPFPSFAARNFGSGQFVNLSSGLINGLGDLQNYGREFGRAHRLTKLAASDPSQLSKADHDLLREVYAFRVAGNTVGFGDVSFATPTTGTGPIAGILPGSPLGVRQSAQEVRQSVAGNPAYIDNIPGGMAARRGVRVAVDTGKKLNQQVEWHNRVPMYAYLRKKGYSASAAAKKVNDLQFDYSDLTPFEKDVMRRAFPFYTFSRKIAPLVLTTLLERPGGVLGQTIRATNAGQGQQGPLPDHVAQTSAIPMGELDDGSQRYLTGLGLAHEVPLGYLGGGVRGALTEAASQLNPLVKAPLEWATGESFFQRGPLGGRDLVDMDPTLGRLATNLGLQDETPTGRAAPLLGSSGLEFLIGNSPASRLTTTARTLTDPRKYEGALPGAAAGVNLLTGLKLSDVSPATQDSVTRDTISALMRDAGASAFEMIRWTKQAIEETRKTDPEKAAQMERENALLSYLVKRARERKKEKAAAGLN